MTGGTAARHPARKNLPRRLLPGLILLLAGAELHAQFPETEIYLAPMRLAGGGIEIGAPENITSRPGYDNQPSFLPGGEALLYTSILDDGQADSFLFNLQTKSRTNLTHSPESEYSPTPLPGGQGFSVVRVEKDSTQRLWQFSFGGGEPALVFARIRAVGYHAWISPQHAALFLVGAPTQLLLVSLPGDSITPVAENVGRSLAKIPGEAAFSFVHKIAGDTWWIKRYDMAARQTNTLVQTLPGAEDLAWTPDGRVLMGKGQAIYQWRPGARGWEKVVAFEGAGLDAISRLAVRADGRLLAIVAQPRQ